MKLTMRAMMFALATGLVVGCETVDTPKEKEALAKDATASRQAWRRSDPTIEGVMKNPRLRLFPDVGRGGFIVAGSHGNGVVYEQGQQVGFAELTGGSIGFTSADRRRAS